MNNRFFPVIVGLDERVAPAKFIVCMLQPHGRLHLRICVGNHLRSLHRELSPPAARTKRALDHRRGQGRHYSLRADPRDQYGGGEH
jgi:hypothetical protein